jgi:UPF0755 protein
MSKAKILILILLIIVLGVAAAVFAYFNGLKAVDPNDKNEITVTVIDGSGANAIIEQLDEAGLVKDPLFAKVNARLTGYDSLQANTYVLNRSMSFPEIMNVINTGDFKYISKTAFRIAEGARLTQSAEALSDVTQYSSEEIMAKWDSKDFVQELIDEYWFLTKDILGEDVMHPLEGYLFPDTYYITEEDPSIESITKLALDEMDEVLTARKAEIEKSDYSIHQFLTLASIVTKEGCATEEDAAHIAGVFSNRLEKEMSLGSDVTVCYIFDEDRVDLKQSQLESDSPYNARKVSGMIPGPICSVPVIAIDGVLNATDTEDLFFYAGPDGTIYYAKTNEEHLKNVNAHPWTEEDLNQ